jgi:hypothetical protein
MFPKIDVHFATRERRPQAPSAQRKARSRASAPQIFGEIYLPNPDARTLASEPLLTLPKDADTGKTLLPLRPGLDQNCHISIRDAI